MNTDKIIQERLLLSSSLSHMKMMESHFHLSAARLESAKRLYPTLLTQATLLPIQCEYLISKIRYEKALEDVQQRWVSLKLTKEERLKNDR